jgi:hypothetical protein
MAQPTSSDVHADAALTDFSIAYIQDNQNFIGGNAIPSFPVEHKSDLYFVFNKDDWMRDDAVKVRAENEEAPMSGFTLSKGSYNATPWWTAVPLSQMVAANADPGLPLDKAAAQLVTQRMLIRRERLFATGFMNSSSGWNNTWTGSAGAGSNFTSWDDYASDPEKNIDDAKNTLVRTTGFEGNILTVGYSVHQALKRHPIIKDRIKHTSAESITAEIIATFFELEEYHVSKAAYSTTNEGASSPTQAFAVPSNALLTYKEGAPTLMSPTAATIFAWSGLTGLNNAGVRIDQYYDEKKKQDVVRGEFAFAMVITGADLGFLFVSATH